LDPPLYGSLVVAVSVAACDSGGGAMAVAADVRPATIADAFIAVITAEAKQTGSIDVGSEEMKTWLLLKHNQLLITSVPNSPAL